ncbi:SVEP1 [Symbiodinium microadriaticum]|nr:SVEP1 [Symbiodinium microadriaticum]
MPGGIAGNESCYAARPASTSRTSSFADPSVQRQYCERRPQRCTGKGYEVAVQAVPRILQTLRRGVVDFKIAGLSIVDWDGDCDLDIVTSHEDGRLGLFLQDPDGKLNEADGAFSSIQVGKWAKPSTFDWDGVGELNILVGNEAGELIFFKGSGSGAVEPTPSTQAVFQQVYTFNYTAPAMGDLNNDSYPDLVLGHACQLDVYLGQENGALSFSASFKDFSPSREIWQEERKGTCAIVPAILDWDGDELLDVVVGDYMGKLYLCRFASSLMCDGDAFDGFGAGGMAAPAGADWDGDGSPDLLVQSSASHDLLWFRQDPSGALQLPEDASPFHLFDVGEHAVPVLVDWDRDGDLDLIVGSADGRLWYFPQENGKFTSFNRPHGPFANVDVGSDCAPTAVDWDSDGFPDVVIGNAAGKLVLLKGAGKHPPQLVEASPFSAIDVKIRIRPAVVDWDGDGDLDLIVLTGFRDEPILYFKNQRSIFTQVHRVVNPFADVKLFDFNNPAQSGFFGCFELVDFDSDGDLDLLLAQSSDDTLSLLEQLSDGSFMRVTGRQSPFPDVISLAGAFPDDGPLHNLCPAHGDIDGDGVADIVLGDQAGRVTLLHRRVQQEAGPGRQQLGVANPFNEIVAVGPCRQPTVIDWNKDGRPDVLINQHDSVRMFLQQADGSLREPSPAEIDAATNETFAYISSLATWAVTGSVSMTAADWNRDGDQDLVILHSSGIWLLERSGANFLPASQLFTWHPDMYYSVRAVAVADWDGDGYLDILAGNLNTQKVMYLRQDSSIGLYLVPEEESPFSDIVTNGMPAPAVADIDGDGKLELLVGMVGELWTYHRDESEKLVWTSTQLFTTGYLVPVLVDWDGDGEVEAVVGTFGDLMYLKRQVCSLQDACFHDSGICRSRSQVCQCLQGHTGNDCSKCARGFSSSPRSSEDGHRCYSCPGLQSGNGTCSSRGVCIDDDLVQRLALAAGTIDPSEVHVLRGAGVCACNAHFFGEDCSQGECPAGQEPTLDLTSRSTFCRTCLQGTGKEQMGNHACGACPPGAAANGTGFCAQCDLGSYQARHGQAACMLCEAGRAPSRDGTHCQRYVRGTFAAAGSPSCQRCDKGFYQPTPGQAECLLCDAGSSTDDGRTSCAPCPPGTMGRLPGAACTPCSMFTTADASRTHCVIDWVLMVGAAAFTIQTLVFFKVLVFLPGVRRSIADITWSVVDEAVILTTQGSHHFGSRLMKVRLQDTEVPWLDHGPKNPFLYVRRLSPTQLQLFTELTLPLTQVSEASIGTLKPLFMVEAFGTVFLRIPVLIWLAIIAVGLIIICSLVRIPWWYVVLTAILDAALLLFLQIRQAAKGTHTPLRSLLRKYEEHLQAVNPFPVACDPGPNRSVSVAQVLHLNEFFRPLIQHRNMHYICPNIVKPTTSKWELSFAEVAGNGMVDWFISHFWGLPFNDFTHSLRAHAMQVGGGNWEALRYWICTFSNNQWRLDEEIPPGATPRESSFYKALTAPSCQGTGMMLDTEPARACLFMGLCMLTPNGVLNAGRGSLDTALKIGRQLATLRLENASATRAQDKQRIDDEVRNSPGGFVAINRKLRGEINLVLEQMSERFANDLTALTSQLHERDVQDEDVDSPTVPEQQEGTSEAPEVASTQEQLVVGTMAAGDARKCTPCQSADNSVVVGSFQNYPSSTAADA